MSPLDEVALGALAPSNFVLPNHDAWHKEQPQMVALTVASLIAETATPSLQESSIAGHH